MLSIVIGTNGCSVETASTPTLTPKAKVEILEHHLVKEDYPPPDPLTMTYIRGQVINMGEIALTWSDVTIWVRYQVEGLENMTYSSYGSIDSEIRLLKPGEIRNFEVVVQDGAKEGYDISVSIY